MKENMDAFKHIFINTSAFMTVANQKPFYYADRPDLVNILPDKYFSILIPVAVYWLVAIPFDILDYISPAFLEKYRIHESAEVRARNRVSKPKVIVTVLFQQLIQILLGLWALEEDDNANLDHIRSIQNIQTFLARSIFQVLGAENAHKFVGTSGPALSSWIYWWGIPALQFVFAMFIMDTWQYTLHRLFHTIPFLYRHIHSWHHRLYVPFAYGALYNHPIEGFLLDLLGGLISLILSRMTVRQGTLLFAIATAKTIHDHSGWSLPFDPMQFMFRNNADYHDIHHQMIGIKNNFSQPFFVHWDSLLGTEMTRKQFQERKNASRAKAKTS